MCCAVTDFFKFHRNVWIRADFLGYSPDVDGIPEDEMVGGTWLEKPLPERLVTPNMLIALNMTRWRVAADLTQEQLGEQLGDWTKTAVSAAERSWDGKRVRQFDADLVVRLAAIFGVPVSAMYLPPADDGEAYRYLVDTGVRTIPAGDFFGDFSGVVPRSLFIDVTAAHRSYENALVAAVARYQGSGVAEVLTERLSQRATDVKMSAALSRVLNSSETLTNLEDVLGDMKDDNTLLTDLLVTVLRQTQEGRAHLEDQDRQDRQRAAASLLADRSGRRQLQEQFVEIGHALFGERGPMTRKDLAEVIAEARERGIDGAPITRQRFTDGAWELLDPRDGRNRR
jgi:hypothetical protein